MADMMRGKSSCKGALVTWTRKRTALLTSDTRLFSTVCRKWRVCSRISKTEQQSHSELMAENPAAIRTRDSLTGSGNAGDFGLFPRWESRERKTDPRLPISSLHRTLLQGA